MSLALTLCAFGCAEESDPADEVAGDAMTAGTAAAGTAADMPAAGTPAAGTPAAGMPAAGTTGDNVTGGMTSGGMMPVAGTDMPSGDGCDPAFIECYNQCESMECAGMCFTNASSETQTLFNGFQNCVQNSGCQDNACVLMTCGSEYEACFGPLAMGTASCGDIFGCLQNCGPNDQMCAEACITSGSVEAQIQFSDVQ
jgi:hypothetical protein